MEDAGGRSYGYADFGSRFVAFIIDGLLILPFYIPILAATIALDPQTGEVPGWFPMLMIICIIGIFGIIIWNILIRQAKTGQTVGKKIMGVAVLNNSYGTIGFGSNLLRETIGKWISGLLCYVGFLNMLWDAENQTWHDKICSTHVYQVGKNFS